MNQIIEVSDSKEKFIHQIYHRTKRIARQILQWYLRQIPNAIVQRKGNILKVLFDKYGFNLFTQTCETIDIQELFMPYV